MKKRPVVVRLVGAALTLLLLWQGLATVSYLSGSTQLANIAGKGTINAYMTPLFKQYWSVFAPDPIQADTELLIRAKVNGSDTDWFNISRADVQRSILHHPVPSRLYLTNFALTSHYQVSAELLPPGLQSVPKKSFVGADWLDQLKKDLQDGGSAKDAAAINQFTKDETAMTSMVSSVALARWGEAVTAVQIKIRTIPVKPYAERNNADYQVKPAEFDAGWRGIVRVPEIDLAAITAMYGTEAAAHEGN
ncbi:hypothetical protein IV500_03365 [Paeniglutamicibacter antarcticus]|uniref:Uncharacterized protein n=1 Tax=Arthrobacter terrae TaxID=2935737 RepID=A0A931CP81_9MICC|nr:DUF5819 family protein [Arthrobacter terrae]MBG0738466.1 hypothetical protein [Arthrobacter terrae]